MRKNIAERHSPQFSSGMNALQPSTGDERKKRTKEEWYKSEDWVRVKESGEAWVMVTGGLDEETDLTLDWPSCSCVLQELHGIIADDNGGS